MTAQLDADEGYRSIWGHLRDLEFRQGYLDAAGVRTRFAEAGRPDAPALLLLHGTGGHWETFAANLGGLAEHFHCIAIDMVGNGFSEKPDHDYEIPVYVRQVLAVLDSFGISRAHVAAMSLGAWVAARLAVDHPERVDRLILMSPAGLVATASNMARIRAERTRAVQEADWASLKAVFDHLIADERNRLPDLIALRQAIYRRPDTRETIDHLLVLQDAEVRDRNLIPEEQWATISAPTLVIASGQDVSEYQSTARRIAELIPDSRVLEMPGVRHWPHFEDPETFTPAAIAFLRGERA
ncbi:alpha/beta fold hydrolase [Trujillonella humicola]|uniref:alpha/beta fold hydrolase n=1 Tax=Trujillonella humicola TaxID=3383699 RepID=UPI003906A15F